MNQIIALSDELAIIHQPLDNTDLVFNTLNGFGIEFHEVAVAIQVGDTPIEFEKLHEKLIDFEVYLKRHEPLQQPYVLTDMFFSISSIYPKNHRYIMETLKTNYVLVPHPLAAQSFANTVRIQVTQPKGGCKQ